MEVVGMIPVALVDLCQDGGGSPVQTKDPQPPRNRRATEGVHRHQYLDSAEEGCARGRSTGGLESVFKCSDHSLEGGWAVVVSGH